MSTIISTFIHLCNLTTEKWPFPQASYSYHHTTNPLLLLLLLFFPFFLMIRKADLKGPLINSHNVKEHLTFSWHFPSHRKLLHPIKTMQNEPCIHAQAWRFQAEDKSPDNCWLWTFTWSCLLGYLISCSFFALCFKCLIHFHHFLSESNSNSFVA